MRQNITHTLKYLKDQWDILMRPSNANPEHAQICFENIVTMYSADSRYYHTLEHIVDLLKQAERLKFADPASVKLAIFYHDFIYGQASKQSGSNEEQSARAATSHLKILGFDEKTTRRVADLIRMTEHHKANATDRDAALFMDMDMSILGSPRNDYKRYSWQIWQEYQQITKKTDSQKFCERRLAFIERIFPRGARLFTTEEYNDYYGAQAAVNLLEERQYLLKNKCPYGMPIGAGLVPRPS